MESITTRPPTKIHQDDRPITFERIKREFATDPYASIDLRIYRDQAMITETSIYFQSSEVKRDQDKVYEVTSKDVLDQNWYANGMGYILRVYR
jgi:hypothetical protein